MFIYYYNMFMYILCSVQHCYVIRYTRYTGFTTSSFSVERQYFKAGSETTDSIQLRFEKSKTIRQAYS